MNKHHNRVGWIVDDLSGKLREAFRTSLAEGYAINKIFVTNKMDESYIQAACPGAEIVSDPSSIIHDSLIDLVFVSGHMERERGVAAQVLRTGKHLRMI